MLLEAYRRCPDLYARQVLAVRWWQKQAEIADALLRYRRVLVKAAHGVGKSHLAASLVNWHFDCFDPGLTISTAPTQQQVQDVLWKEVRAQRRGRPGLQPKAPRMETSADHFAVGYTAREDSAFQGRHAEHVLLVYDECVGIEAPFWDAGEGMMTSDGCLWMAICNPTDTTSRAWLEAEQTGKWHVITVSALDHPNVAAELAGTPAPYPAAVRLRWVQDRLAEWCEPIAQEDATAADVEFPPGSGRWHRPGPLFESRALGRWPSLGANAVWSEAFWNGCLIAQPVPDEPLVIGCDVARFGDDYTSILARRGGCVLWHETHNGWDTGQTALRLKQIARELCRPGEEPGRTRINVDDDGVGGGVVDRAEGWAFQGISGAARAARPEDYPNRRSELWFTTAERAADGRLDLTRLSQQSRTLLRRQLLAPTYSLDGQGRRTVEPKWETKRRIGRSPDDADALNLAFAAPRRRAMAFS